MSYIKYLNSQFKRKLKDRSYTHGGIVGISEEEQKAIINKGKKKKKPKKKTYHNPQYQAKFNKPSNFGYKFKRDFRKKRIDEKLEELKRLAKIRIKNKFSYEQRRERRHRSKEKCFVCTINQAYYQHHIILLINGGYDNKDNRIPICDTCHAEIHTWMKKMSLEQYAEIQRMDSEYKEII